MSKGLVLEASIVVRLILHCVLQGCVLWHNWWPLLTAFMYVLVPMPYLFFGSASGGSSSIYGGSSLASG